MFTILKNDTDYSGLTGGVDKRVLVHNFEIKTQNFFVINNKIQQTNSILNSHFIFMTICLLVKICFPIHFQVTVLLQYLRHCPIKETEGIKTL